MNSFGLEGSKIWENHVQGPYYPKNVKKGPKTLKIQKNAQDSEIPKKTQGELLMELIKLLTGY